jgi:hypothetical protein
LNELVSCLCPEFGRIHVIGDAVECFLLQDYEPRELVILNDAPVAIQHVSDSRLVCVDRQPLESTWEVKSNPNVRIRLVNVEKRYETLGHKYMALLDLASGPICAHWENDDLWLPWHLSFAVRHLSAGCDMVKESLSLKMDYEGGRWRYWGVWDNLCESQAVFRREAARRAGYGLHNYAQSYYLIDRLSKAGRFRYIDVKPFLSYIFRWNTTALHGECTEDPVAYAARNNDFGDTITPRSVWHYFDIVANGLDAGTPGEPGVPACAGGKMPLGGMSASAGKLMSTAEADHWRALLAGYRARHVAPVAQGGTQAAKGTPGARVAAHGAPRAAWGGKGTIIFLARKEYRTQETKPIVAGLEAAGYTVAFQDDSSSLDTLLRRIDPLRPRPVAVLRWEEHGCLFRTHVWEEFLLYAYSHAIAPIYIDYGYFDRTKNLLLDLYRPPALATIREEWGHLPITVDWNAAPAAVRDYRAGLLALHEKALSEPPLVKGPYAVVWPQQAPTLLRDPFKGKVPARWVMTACERLRALGLTPVVRLSPFQRDLPLPKGIQTLGGAGVWDAGLNVRLATHAKANVICCSSVSNEIVLLGKPVAALGHSWFAGLDVFYEPQDWSDLRHATLPPDDTTRSRWINWWLARQCAAGDTTAAIERKIGRFRSGLLPAKPKPAPVLYVTLHTDDEYYTKTVEPLIASLERHGLPYVVYRFPNTGDWKKNTFLKVRACRRALLEHPDRSIVFLDADAEVVETPKLFNTLSARADFAAHFTRGNALLLSGTIFFNNTRAALRLLDEWERRQYMALRGDQDALDMAISHCRDHGLRAVHLPPAYTRVNEAMHHTRSVIAHCLAHRLGRVSVAKIAH